MAGEGTPSESVDFFSGSQVPEGMSIIDATEEAPAPKKEAKKLPWMNKEESDGDNAGDAESDLGGSDEDGEEADEAESRESRADDKSADDNEEGDPEEKKTEVQQGRKKPVVIKTARKEFQMPPGAKVAVKVDGMEHDVPLAELLQSYSSSKGITKKLGEIKQRETDVQTEREKTLSIVKNFGEKAKDPKGIMPALGDLLDEVGVDALPIAKGLRRTIAASLLEIIEATPAQKQRLEASLYNYEIHEEANYYKHQLEKKSGKEKEVANNQEIVREVNRVMGKVGIKDIPAFQKSFEALKALKADGKLKLDDITPDDVGMFHVISETIEDYFPELENDATARARLFKIAREFEPNREELKAVVRGYLGSEEGQGTAGANGEKPAGSSKPKTVKPGGSKAKLEDLFI